MILLKNKIETEHWGDKVKIVMMLHDCIVCGVDDDFIDTWGPIHEKIMVEGQCINIPGEFIGADTTVTKTWIKKNFKQSTLGWTECAHKFVIK